MTFNSDRLGTVIAGFLYVSIGTAIAATTVGAQNKSTAPAATTSKSATSNAAAANPAACAPVETPDAMCTVPLKKGPETKVCFGDHHPRCFELKTAHLTQTVNGGLIQDSTLTPEQQSNVKSSFAAFTKWLETDLAKKPNKFNSCQNVVSIDSMSEHKVFCLTRLPAKEVDAKTKELLALLEMPVKSKRSSAL